jgi:hypothetical protein
MLVRDCVPSSLCHVAILENKFAMKKLKLAFSTLALLAFSAMSSNAQQYKYETPMPPGVASPDNVDTSIGTLNLSYGYPDAATIQKIYDNLDASRALQAYLLALPIVNQAGMRDTLRTRWALVKAEKRNPVH